MPEQPKSNATAGLIQSVLINIAIPELGRWLASRGSGQPMPTDAEMIAKLHEVCDRGVAAGEAFLRSKGVSLD